MNVTTLKNGVEIPLVGFGTYKLSGGGSAGDVVAEAVKVGYRLIDCATAYGNEAGVGEGLERCGVDRGELFVASKVPNSERGYDTTVAAFRRSLADLRLDYLDLYLIHWPASPEVESDWASVNTDTWRALEDLYREGLVRAIGVCNFQPSDLEVLAEKARILPMVNQIEFNPGMQQRDCVDYCRARDIRIEAWSPLGRGRIFDSEVLRDIARRHGKTVAQICLRWEVQQGVVTIPKSNHLERMRENIDIFDFTLSESEMESIAALPTFGNSGLTASNVDARHR